MLRDYTSLPRAVKVLCLGSLINRAGSFVLIFLTIYVSEQLNFGNMFAALCMGTYGLGSIFAAIIGGQLADQFGRKVVMFGALFGGAVLLVALSFAATKTSVLLTILLYGIVADTFRPACSAMIGDLTTIAQRPAAFGLFYIAINLGFACGPPIGGLLADISYTLLFWGDALTMSAFGFIIIFCVDETKGRAVSDSQPSEQDTPAREIPAREIPALEAARRILTDGPFVLFCASTFLISLVFMQSMATLPIHIRSQGYSNAEFGLFMSLNGILIFVCQLPITHLLQRFNPMLNIAAGASLIAIGFGLYALPGTVPLLLIAVCVWTLGEMAQAPFAQAVVTSLAPVELRARYMGLFTMCYALALTIGAPLGGVILKRQGATFLWLTSAGVALLAVALFCIAYGPVTNRSYVSTMDESSSVTQNGELQPASSAGTAG